MTSIFPYFIFNGIDSRKYGMIMQHLPRNSRAPRNYVENVSNGMDGSTLDLYGYQAYDATLDVALTNTDHIDDILGWLDGTGKITFSDDLARYRNASFIYEVNFDRLSRFRTASITCRFQPFRYMLSEATESVLSDFSSFTITNKGNTLCRPKITIYGSSETAYAILLNGSKVCQIASLNKKITIDSLKMECYRDGTCLNRQKTGDYPVLSVGDNIVQINGDTDKITKVEVEVMSRWL